MRSKTGRQFAQGLGFLIPNLAGFLTFTFLPLIISFAMVFTNWDIRRHNMFSDESLRFVGAENFRRLFAEPDFMQYFGNTLFLMLGIPLGIAGSLGAALLLSRDPGDRGGRRLWRWMLGTAALTGCLCLLVALGLGATATTLCLLGLGAAILTGGSAGGTAVYRSVFFSPHFTSGVATFILWKKMYSPHTGPINGALAPLLDHLQRVVSAVPPERVHALAVLCAAAAAGVILCRAHRMARAWREGEAGTVSVALAAALLAVPVLMARDWAPTRLTAALVQAAGLLAALEVAAAWARGRAFRCRSDYGLATTVLFGGAVAAGGAALLGLAGVAQNLPAWCREGLAPPNWLGAYHWAKPALMLMGLWGAIGSNNMLLYLAGLSNISPELYEAADIDGASPSQRFWHVTWPQLAPITFFIFVMSVIGGLQGGFETARTMTGGGPAGATTTLSYFIYQEGFVTGRLGYASAASWALFVLVFATTLFNWRFGNRYTND